MTMQPSFKNALKAIVDTLPDALPDHQPGPIPATQYVGRVNLCGGYDAWYFGSAKDDSEERVRRKREHCQREAIRNQAQCTWCVSAERRSLEEAKGEAMRSVDRANRGRVARSGGVMAPLGLR